MSWKKTERRGQKSPLMTKAEIEYRAELQKRQRLIPEQYQIFHILKSYKGNKGEM